jgi:HAD superfamily hydrolase (TIGR01509 family)
VSIETTPPVYRPAAVLWDMDGTIVDTEPYWITAEIELVERFGGQWSHHDGLSLVGNGLPLTASKLQGRGVDLPVGEIIELLSTRVLEQLEVAVPWRPGAPELLAELQAEGIPQALVTMSFERMAVRVAELIPSQPFTQIVSGDHVTDAKPHPEAYLLGASRLGVDVTKCIAIEDSPSGLRSAYTAGTVAIGVRHIVDLTDDMGFAILPTLAGISALDIFAFYSQAQEARA